MANDDDKIRNYSSDELKMLYESTVQVTEWRNSTNRFYYSVVVALFAAMGIVFFFGYEQSSDQNTNRLALIATTILALTGIVVSSTWSRLLNYYYGLNAAKFTALDEADPSNIFSYEYQILDRLKKEHRVQEVKAKKAEKSIPYFSLTIFFAAFIMSLLFAFQRFEIVMIFSEKFLNA